ncbi:PAS domain-containing protein [Salmonella enterica subsp. arizonae]|uniref:PAS domain-containing protein n=1 Tax=Salmonella enterica subsp. arizonae TaxID=59203 RepID=A0A379S0J2_SALER|nr:PAS domain-containing protein [Salmonella enterica subsp. arizonae]
MDEMLASIIQGHAQRLDIKTLAGPVQNSQVLDTLSSIGVDLIYGDAIAETQPLDLLLNTSYFAIPLTAASRGYTRYAVARKNATVSSAPRIVGSARPSSRRIAA